MSKFDHQRYPPVGVEIPMAHGTACRSRALQLGRNMTVQYLQPSLLKGFWKKDFSKQQNKYCPRIAVFPTYLPEDLPASDCHRLGHGFKARLLPSSSRMLPRRRACRAHAPLFEWTNVGCLQPCLRAPLSSVPFSSSPSSSSSVCLFFCGGLGVGEKPTRGELVRSTHRVPLLFISSQRFLFQTFR